MSELPRCDTRDFCDTRPEIRPGVATVAGVASLRD